MQKSENKIFFPALAGIRIIAAWMIFLHHIAGEVEIGRLSSIFKEFHVGIFFTISGFLTYILYFDKYNNSEFSFKKFIQKRLARLLPLYWILLLIAAIWQWESIKSFILSFLLLQSYFEDFKFAYVGQAWTIPVQLMFYLTVPMFFFCIKKYNYWFLFWPLSVLLLGLGLMFSFSTISFHGFLANFDFLMIYTFFGRVFEFTIGTLVAKLWYNRMSERILKFKPTFAGALIYLIMLIIISNFQDAENTYGIAHPIGLMLNHILLPFSIGLFLIGLCAERTYFSKFLSTPFMILLGNSAYAFYLIHVGYFSEFVYFQISSNLLIRFICLNILAVLIYRFLELPIQRALLSFRK
ncbi:acyltransferase [Marivirga tractuosa]|uniref:Acyltransferase 3 n=1 Tax=Marivirga tractuosa (strain ATCC 23168 / DSM 4126 / NBRC 15989 / NCIMB 1408 / VKM B-1430 / H-43) TaxID=643867 RepID=E4TV40_MARTH|nr:acyltransferase [Marivirga tractuosa]ADR22133.1 acyltransferase 3 [Marivirga tractuosa DSM 4126]BDD13405.1 acyltransferase [Marivirga tractuosa]